MIDQRYIGLNIGKTDICKKCRSKFDDIQFLSYPLPYWHIGKNFQKDIERVLFVGKVARGNPGQILSNGLVDGENTANKLYEEKSWQFWFYLRGIIEALYSEGINGWDHIALTNMIKCNNSLTIDVTTELTKHTCLNENRFIWKEIEFLKPTTIIFLTSWGYDNFIEEYRVEKGFENRSSRSHRINCGERMLPWWEIVDKTTNIRILRTGHPERKKKDEFINLISGYIKSKR